MYPNLEAELKRKNIKRQKIGEILNLSQSTISQKLTGQYDIKLKEAKKIKEFLKVDIPLEILFKEKKGE